MGAFECVNRVRATCVLAFASFVCFAASATLASTSDGEVGPGYRRVYREERVVPTRRQLERSIADCKPMRLDPSTGDMIRNTFSDHLPGNWKQERPSDLPADARIDSFGNPIVNDTPGLPAWSQRDVDALRDEIVRWRAKALLSRIEGHDVDETERILGNFIGQAISRAISIDDLVSIDDANMVTAGVARATLDYLHFYENIRFANQPLFGYTYAPSAYPQRVAKWAEAHGRTLAEVQALDSATLRTDRGGQPSGCYTRTAFARGMTLLTTPTVLWSANGFDDESADVPTGFPVFLFYTCQNPANNDSVRVSTNGYISFFQQGGGATDGTNLSNDAIPSGTDPDGFAAPWWDDLIVATAQGNTDTVQYKTEGAIDSRVFTVEWFSITRLGGLTTDFHFFQVKLYETTDVVELHISTDWSADSGDNATCGIENYSGAGGDCGPNCLNTNATPPPNNYRFTPSPRPGNDACAGAVEVISGSVVTDTLVNATADGTATCGSSSGNRDVWFTIVPRCSGTLKVTTCGTRDINGPATGIDSVLSAYSACPGTTGNQLACNDDAGGVGCATNDSEISLPATAGQRVFVRVTHFGDLAFRFASGAFRLRFDVIPTSPVAGDSCAQAVTVFDGNTRVASLLCASNDGSADCGSSTTNPDLWYSFTAPRDGLLRASACGSRNNAGTDTGPDTAVSIHAGCPGVIANELSCNDDGFVQGCNTLDSAASAVVRAGQNVKIRVSHFGDTTFRVGNGVTVLNVTLRPCPADFNASLSVTVQDVFDFLTAWFNGSLAADFNNSGTVTIQDVFDFLTAWFAGC